MVDFIKLTQFVLELVYILCIIKLSEPVVLVWIFQAIIVDHVNRTVLICLKFIDQWLLAAAPSIQLRFHLFHQCQVLVRAPVHGVYAAELSVITIIRHHNQFSLY